MQEKFQQLMQEEQLTATRLADVLGVQPAVVSHILSGRNKPSFPVIQKILRSFPHINPDWLLLDSEQMYRDGHTPQSVSHVQPNDLFSALAPEPEKPDSGRKNGKTLTSRESNISERTAVGPKISDSREMTASGLQANIQQPRIERVIVLYSDGSFRDFAKQ